MSDEPLLKFPCDLPIKVMGRNEPGFREAALRIVRAHYTHLEEERVGEQESRGGNYLSLTITLPAQSREEVDAVFRELTASDDILIVL